MKTRWKSAAIVAALLLGLASGAQAIQAIGPTSLQNGFPVWIADNANFPVAFFPAGVLGLPPDGGNPFSVLTGFGDESFYWIATANFPGGELMEVAMEAAYAAGPPINGDQMPFARTRLRAPNAPAGNCNVTTPFQALTVPGPINFTDDVLGVAPDFLGLLTAPHTTFFLPAGVVVPPGGGVITATGVGPQVSFGCIPGATTNNWTVDAIAFSTGPNAAPTAVADTAVTRSGTPVTIDVAANDTDPQGLAPAAGGLNPKATAIVVPGVTAATLPRVAVSSFAPGANTPTPTTTVVVIGPGEPVTTANGGSVVKNPDGTLTYTPAAGFVGSDTFQYVIQDIGGMASGQVPGTATAANIPVGTGNPVPGTVTVTVLRFEVTKAEFRPKLMKWSLNGVCTAADGTQVSIFAGPTADPAALIGTATVTAGTWAFEGKSTASPAGVRSISLQWRNPAAPAAAIPLLDQPLTIR